MSFAHALEVALRRTLEESEVVKPAPDTPDDAWPARPHEDHFSVEPGRDGVSASVLLPCSRCVDGWTRDGVVVDGRHYASHCRCMPWRSAADALMRSGMPREAYAMTFGAYDAGAVANKAEVGAAMRSQHMLLWGATGTGKTHLVTASLRHAVLTQGARGTWIRWPDALERLKSKFGQKEGDPHRADTEATIRRWSEVDVLVIDELGAEKASEWTRVTLERVLSQAIDYGARLVLTSNLPPARLEPHVGARAWSRLQRCVMCRVDAADYRARGTAEPEKVAPR